MQFGGASHVISHSGPVEVTNETKKLLDSHQEVPTMVLFKYPLIITTFVVQNLSKLSSKLDDERKKAMADLEHKMRQRKMQREKTIAQLASSNLLG